MRPSAVRVLSILMSCPSALHSPELRLLVFLALATGTGRAV